MEKNLGVAKIVATSNPASWSQAYNAGRLFAVLSLEKEGEADENILSTLGKETIENLEAEFFTIEHKTLETVKKAVEKSLDKVPTDVVSSFAIGTVVGNILYVFVKGGGKILIKRGGKIGEVLSSENELSTGSGFLEDGDHVILETKKFSEIVDTNVLSQSLQGQFAEITENLAPMVHEKEEGAASAIVVEYKKEEETLVVPTLPEEEQTQKRINFAVPHFLNKYSSILTDRIRMFRLGSVDHSKRLFLSIAVLIGFVFLISIFLAVKRQNDAKTKALFEQYYVSAQKKYDEGQSLLDLNKSLARDSFYSAQKLLLEGEPKFSKGSSEREQVDDLLNKVNDQISGTANAKQVNPTEAKTSDSLLLSSELSSNVDFATKEVNDIYTLDSSGVNKNGKQIIKKDWGNVGGLGIYFGNIYILNKASKQVLKYVSTASEYVKATYFAQDTNPDISSATSMAIDGSVWILLKDGTILKFTRGSADSFQLSGLDRGFSSPTRIFTNADSDNVYVLDNGNSRIVAFDKKGAYVSQYQSSMFKTAKDLEVREKDKKVFILNGSKLFKFDL